MRTVMAEDGRTTITSPYMNLFEAALYCRCAEADLARAMAARTVTYLQLSQTTIVFRQDDLDAYMKNHEVLDRYNYHGGPPDDAAPDQG